MLSFRNENEHMVPAQELMCRSCKYDAWFALML